MLKKHIKTSTLLLQTRKSPSKPCDNYQLVWVIDKLLIYKTIKGI